MEPAWGYQVAVEGAKFTKEQQGKEGSTGVVARRRGAKRVTRKACGGAVVYENCKSFLIDSRKILPKGALACLAYHFDFALGGIGESPAEEVCKPGGEQQEDGEDEPAPHDDTAPRPGVSAHPGWQHIGYIVRRQEFPRGRRFSIRVLSLQ